MNSFIENVSNSPLNLSKSKQAWSFGKAKRDKDDFNPVYTQTLFYETEANDFKKGVSFGVGNRFNYHHKEQLDIPFYDVRDRIGSKSPKFSFTSGRDKYKRHSVDTSMVFDSCSPGPAAYGRQEVFGSEGVKVSITSKPKGTFLENSSTDVNAPYYSPVDKNDKGQYVLSTHKTTNCVRIVKPTVSKKQEDPLPGPGQYPIKGLLEGNDRGEIYISKYKSPHKFTLKGKKVVSSKHNVTPGPGHYRIFSEFGYDKHSKNHHEKDKLDKIYKKQKTKQKIDFAELRQRTKSAEFVRPLKTEEPPRKQRIDLSQIFGADKQKQRKKEQLTRKKEQETKKEEEQKTKLDFASELKFSKLKKKTYV